MSPGACIDYKTLREINPETARKVVVEYLKTNGGNKAGAARVFSIHRISHQPSFVENVDLAPGIFTHHDRYLADGITGTRSLDLVDYILAMQGQVLNRIHCSPDRMEVNGLPSVSNAVIPTSRVSASTTG